MIPVVSFVGGSNSGKTTLLEKVIRELKLRGCRVAVIKHSHHDFDIDQPGKDSWRFTQAGSDIVALSSPNKVAFIERVDTEFTLSRLAALFEGKADIVLTEGYKNGNSLKILVLGNEPGYQQLCLEDEPLVTLVAHSSALGVPEFEDTDVHHIANLLIRIVDESSPRKVLVGQYIGN